VIGSGNLVHNLHAYSWGRHTVEPFDWAVRFETQARQLLEAHEHGPLIDYASLGPDASLSVPTPDHYLPLLYVIAGCMGEDEITFSVEGVDGGSISMLSIRLG
jgi:4,5-DOPA dioxygenase extradiol